MEETSYKIMRTSEFIGNPEPAIYYRANCGCLDPECGVNMELEYDKNIKDVTLSLYTDMVYCSWWQMKKDTFYFFKDMYYRIKGALRILLTGRIKLEEAFLFSSVEQFDAFIAALEEGRTKLRNEVAERLNYENRTIHSTK